MDNQKASPAIQVPNVPADFCPKGDLRYIFQRFVDLVLKNATLSIPGLGDVTPEEIQNIQTELQNQQNQIDANALLFRYGQVDVANGDQTIPVAFVSGEGMPSGDYHISLTLVTTLAALDDPETVISYKDGTAQALGFGINVANGVAGQKIKWGVIGRPT